MPAEMTNQHEKAWDEWLGKIAAQSPRRRKPA
jgi:hypothetical protein